MQPHPFSDHSAGASASANSGSASHNPTQQMAQSWTQHRQQERSVLSSRDSDSLDAQLVRSDRSPGRLLGRHSMHTGASQPFNHQVPTRSTSLTDAHSSSLTRRQSEPQRSIDDEWPIVGTPPVNLPKHTPFHLPPPSPSRRGARIQHQPQTQQAAEPPGVPFGLPVGWAAGLARGAEWMGEATGLRFLARPFQRSAPNVEAASSNVSAAATFQHSSPVRRHSVDSHGQTPPADATPTTSPVQAARQASVQSMDGIQDNQPISASAPSRSMSYRERLLAGAAASNAAVPSFSRQPAQQSQMGFPSQQELQASQARLSSQSPAAASLSVAQRPAGHLSQLVPQANQAQMGWTSMYAPLSQGIAATALENNADTTAPQEPLPTQVHQEQPAEQAAQFMMPPRAADGSSALPNFNWPGHVTLNGQLLEAQQHVAAALPPSMLNMGWEYPAQLLQGADPVLSARHRGGREDASQQPNDAVSISARLSADLQMCNT